MNKFTQLENQLVHHKSCTNKLPNQLTNTWTEWCAIAFVSTGISLIIIILLLCSCVEIGIILCQMHSAKFLVGRRSRPTSGCIINIVFGARDCKAADRSNRQSFQVKWHSKRHITHVDGQSIKNYGVHRKLGRASIVAIECYELLFVNDCHFCLYPGVHFELNMIQYDCRTSCNHANEY